MADIFTIVINLLANISCLRSAYFVAYLCGMYQLNQK